MTRSNFCRHCGAYIEDRDECPKCGPRTVAWDRVIVDDETLPLPLEESSPPSPSPSAVKDSENSTNFSLRETD